MKRINKILSMLLTLCLLLGSAACSIEQPGQSTPVEPSQTVGSSAVDTGETTVTIRLLSRVSGSEQLVPVWNEAIEIFKQENPNVIVEDLSVANEAAYNDKFKTLLATGDLPNIFYIPGVASLVQYAREGLIMDVSPLMEDKEWYDGFASGLFDMWNFASYGVPGHYAVPFSVSPEVVLYNKDLFAQAGIETIPETMDDLYVAIDKLNAIGVTPIACSGKDTWRIGHLHNQLLYRWCGVQKAKDLGARNAKWTDPEVVDSIALLKDLQDRGAFAEGFEGMSHDIEKQMFLEGKSAMMVNGPWFLGDIDAAGMNDVIGTFAFPYFTEKPEFKNELVNYPQGFCLKGGMEGAELEATVNFIKIYTGKLIQTKFVSEINTMAARKDLGELEVSDLFRGYQDALERSDVQGGDSFDYDPLSSMQDRTRNSLLGMLLGNTPQEAAEEIQAEIDKAS